MAGDWLMVTAEDCAVGERECEECGRPLKFPHRFDCP